MEQSIPPADAESSRLVVRPQAVSTGTPTSDQYPCVGHPEPLVSPFASDDCTTEDAPDRSSFDSLLILPEPPGPPSVQTAQQVKPCQPHPGLSTLRTWFLEVLSSFLLLIAVSAIVATLYIHDGQPLPQWPFDITINAMLSIYAVVLKASMAFILTSCIGQSQWRWFNTSSRSLQDLVLFHDAGQGPWGSISWLWAYRLGQPVAALGAFITIVGMAVDPFVQQLIHPVDCMEQLQGAPAASVPTTNIITYSGLPDALQPSIVGGFYTSQNLTDFECSTGNCTFAEDYTTLGFCSSCEDVSDKVTITTNCTVKPSDDSTKLYRGPCDARPEGPVIWDINTTSTPFNLNFHNDRMDTAFIVHGVTYYEGDNSDVFAMESTKGTVPEMLYGSNGESDVNYDFDLGVIYGMSDNSVDHVEPGNPMQSLIGCGDATTKNTWYCRGYGAATCLMRPCLRTYFATVEAGRLTETMVEHTDPGADWGYSSVDDGEFVAGSSNERGYFGLVDKSCISNDQHQQLATAGYNGVGETENRWLPYKVTYDPTRPNATAYNTTLSASLLASRCLFLVEDLFVDRMWDEVLDVSFFGTVKRDSGGYNPTYSKVLGRPSVFFTGPDPLRYLWNSGRVNMTRINDSMANLAQALTLWVRSAGAKGRGGGQEEFFSTRATGQVLHYATCAQVTWAWIALPASLTALTLLCLAATMVTTAWGRVPVWKSSPLTVLFHGPGGRYWVDEGLLAAATTNKSAATTKRSDGDNIMTEIGMEKFASRVSVKLGDNGGQGELRLRQVAAVSKKRRWWERKHIR